ncbi:MAG: hypothetical protein HY842_16800 [Bacteroidetes bacterium]|nr:hypothetical protein [Bacteroidota bacterium]
MKKILLATLTATLLAACCDDTSNVGNPVCIDDTIETFKTDSQSIAVLKTDLNGQFLFWFQTEAPWADGTDDVLNEECEVVCLIGGFRIDPCDCMGVNFCELTFDTLWHR